MSGIEQSLSNLRTDHLDVLLMHAVGTKEELDQILSDSGALRAAEEAKRQGKIRHIGISMHGQPDILLEALHRYDFEALMATINYFDHCNFPSIIGELLPLAAEKGCAVILMKALADGYLYRNAEAALRFALTQPVSVAVAGINSMEMLREDLAIVSDFKPMTAQEIDDLMRSAPELGSYVCRQCGMCRCPQGLDLQRIFSLEALYDRQMGDGNVQDAGFYALKERLKHWFGGKERAVRDYAELAVKAGACTDCGSCLPDCPFGIDIPAKLRNIDYKLDRQYGKIYE